MVDILDVPKGTRIAYTRHTVNYNGKYLVGGVLMTNDTFIKKSVNIGDYAGVPTDDWGNPVGKSLAIPNGNQRQVLNSREQTKAFGTLYPLTDLRQDYELTLSDFTINEGTRWSTYGFTGPNCYIMVNLDRFYPRWEIYLYKIFPSPNIDDTMCYYNNGYIEYGYDRISSASQAYEFGLELLEMAEPNDRPSYCSTISRAFTPQLSLLSIRERLMSKYYNADMWKKLATEAYSDLGFWDGNGIAYIKDLIGLKDQIQSTFKLIKKLPKSKFQKVAKIFSNLYLSIHYGYKLSIADSRDLVTYLKKLERLFTRPNRLVASALENNVTYTYQVYYHMFRQLSDALEIVVKAFDLDLTLENIWDSIPYSFVIDWFVSVGDSLTVLENFMELRQDHEVIAVNRSIRIDEVLTASDISASGLQGIVQLRYYRRIYNATLETPSYLPSVTINASNHINEISTLIMGALKVHAKPCTLPPLKLARKEAFMATTGSYGTVFGDGKSISVQDVSWTTDYAVQSSTANEVKLVNTKTPVDQPQTVRIAQNQIKDVYKNTTINPAYFLPSKAGESTVIQTDLVYRVKIELTTGDTKVVDLPVHFHTVIQNPISEYISADLLNEALRRHIGEFYATGKTDSTLINDLMRGALNPLS